jgi:UDP-N-acetylmuramate-alanine ligase
MIIDFEKYKAGKASAEDKQLVAEILQDEKEILADMWERLPEADSEEILFMMLQYNDIATLGMMQAAMKENNRKEVKKLLADHMHRNMLTVQIVSDKMGIDPKEIRKAVKKFCK